MIIAFNHKFEETCTHYQMPTDLTVPAAAQATTELCATHCVAAYKLACPDPVWPASTRALKHGYVMRRGTAVLIALRGSITIRELAQDAHTKLVPFKGYGRVHSGFLEMLEEQMRDISAAIEGATDVIVTGHSSGAAMGALLMLWLAREQPRKTRARAVLFACPMVGDAETARGMSGALRHSVTFVTNTTDVVPLLPPFGYYAPSAPRTLRFTTQSGSVLKNHSMLHSYAPFANPARFGPTR